MSVRTKPKHKIDRRLGVNLWGRDKSPFIKRNYGPGQHGAAKKKPTDYGMQLRAKQMLRGYYGNLNERQFRKVYQEAIRRKGDTAQNMVALLETRLDAVVYRMKFAATIFGARQLVNHGHIFVNGKRLNIPSAHISEGDEIMVDPKLKENPHLIAATELKERDVPEYITVENQKGTFNRIPVFEEVPYPVTMQPHLVIEFYSR